MLSPEKKFPLFCFFFLSDDFGSDEDNEFGEEEEEDEDGGSDYEAKKGKKGKKGKVEKSNRRSLKRKRDSGGSHYFSSNIALRGF